MHSPAGVRVWVLAPLCPSVCHKFAGFCTSHLLLQDHQLLGFSQSLCSSDAVPNLPQTRSNKAGDHIGTDFTIVCCLYYLVLALGMKSLVPFTPLATSCSTMPFAIACVAAQQQRGL